MPSYILINEQIRQNAIEAVKNAEIGEMVTIKPKKQSEAQRDYFHVLCRIIAKHTGHSEEDIKFMLKKSVLGMRVLQHFDGTIHFVVNETRSLNSKDYSNLIEATMQLGEQLGCQLPLAAMYGLDA